MTEVPAICHEASGVIGVVKPAGLPTQAPPGIDSLESWLRARRPVGAYLGVPHRLDRAVSGVMVFAATPRAARHVSRQFERRQIGKSYLALVPSNLDLASGQDDGLWVDWIEKVADEPRAQITRAGMAGSREARTLVRAIGSVADPRGEPLMLLRLEPLTGRMHQLRVQAAARGVPILGDTLYGGMEWHASPDADARARPIALHAGRISFADPDTGHPVALSASLPNDWPAACRDLMARVEETAATGAAPTRHG